MSMIYIVSLVQYLGRLSLNKQENKFILLLLDVFCDRVFLTY